MATLLKETFTLEQISAWNTNKESGDRFVVEGDNSFNIRKADFERLLESDKFDSIDFTCNPETNGKGKDWEYNGDKGVRTHNNFRVAKFNKSKLAAMREQIELGKLQAEYVVTLKTAETAAGGAEGLKGLNAFAAAISAEF